MSTKTPTTSPAASAATSPAAAPPFTPRGWRALHPVARGLMATRFFRSMAQGALVVDFVLYLKDLGWSAAAIGLLLGATNIVGAALLLSAGVLSDRLGRRPFLLGYQLANAAGALAVVLSPRSWVLVLVALLLGYGRGANGAAGPFAPVEQAWLAGSVRAEGRSQAFSLNAALGFFGMGVGTLIGAAVPLFARFLQGPAAFEPLFVFNLAVALLTTWMIARLEEPTRPGGRLPAERRGAADGTAGSLGAAPTHAVASETAALRRRENVALALLTTVNSVNALGIGLIGPLLPYWFAVRYGAGPEAIGSVYALSFFLTAVSSLVTGEVGARLGVVRSVVGPRAVGVATLFAMPLMPVYAWAAALYTFRSILNRGTAGTRQAFSMGLVRDERRGLAGSLNALSFRMPSALGAAASGWLMGMGLLDLPFFLAAGFQLAYVVLFGTVLKRYENGTSG